MKDITITLLVHFGTKPNDACLMRCVTCPGDLFHEALGQLEDQAAQAMKDQRDYIKLAASE